MFRSIALALLLLVSTPVLAQTNVANPCANIPEATRGLGMQETQTLLESCRVSLSAVDRIATPENAAKWSDAAKGFASALGTAAKELGVATNDFLNSPAGYLLAAILLFNYAGGAIIGFPFSIFSLLFWWHINRRTMTKAVAYEYVPYLWGAFRIKRVTSTNVEKTDYTAAFGIISGLALGIMNLIVWMNVT